MVAACRASSRISRLLPIPAAPKIVTSCGVWLRTVRCSALMSRPRSCSRSTIGVGSVASSPGRTRRAATASHIRLDRDRPRSTVAACSTYSIVGARGGVGVLADEDAAAGRELLQPGGRVDDVTGDDGLPAVAGRGDVDQRLAGRDADPEAQPGRRDPVLPGQHALQFEGGPHAAQRIVLGRDRRAEQRHRRVPDVLLDDTAVLPDDPPYRSEVVVLQRPYLFGVGALRVGGELHDVDEQHADPAPVGGRLLHGSAAARAEHGPDVLGTAAVWARRAQARTTTAAVAILRAGDPAAVRTDSDRVLRASKQVGRRSVS